MILTEDSDMQAAEIQALHAGVPHDWRLINEGQDWQRWYCTRCRLVEMTPPDHPYAKPR